jgi:biotin carboxylase
VKTVMILGAGVMQAPGIRIAKAKGWHTIVVDGNPEALARGMGDEFAVVDLKDRDGLLALARSRADAGGLDGVFTAGTDFSSSVAYVAERLGLPGIGYETAMRATDKVLMREAFARAGVPSPAFACWTGVTDPRRLVGADLRFPLVVKPVDNMGARGVRRVDDPESLDEACREALALSRGTRVIVESFMEGPELSLDAVVHRGRVTVCGVADRHIFFPPSFVEMGHTMPTDLPPDAAREVERVFIMGIQAIGIDNGAAKGDLKLTASGPKVGEIAARLSGGYMSGWTFPLASGVRVTEAALNIAVGLPPGSLEPTLRRTCAERALISIPGVVAELLGEPEARAVPGVAEVFLRVGPGDAVVFPSNNVQKCGNVIAAADTRAGAVGAAEAALSRLLPRLQALRQETTRHLAAAAAHEAFGLLPPAVRGLLRGMRAFEGDPRAAAARNLEIPVPPLIEGEPSRDWYGNTLLEAASRACAAASARLVREGQPREGGFTPAGAFWRAVARAGSQGGLYVLDSVREAAAVGRVRELLDAL